MSVFEDSFGIDLSKLDSDQRLAALRIFADALGACTGRVLELAEAINHVSQCGHEHLTSSATVEELKEVEIKSSHAVNELIARFNLDIQNGAAELVAAIRQLGITPPHPTSTNH